MRTTAVPAQQEVDGLAVLVDGAIKVVPFRFDRDVRLVHSPRCADGLEESVPPLLELRDVPGHPSQDRRMGDLDATLCHHLDQVSVRQPIGDVPPHAQLGDVGIEYTFAVHRVTRDRLRHSEPPAKDPAVYPMPLDAPEPARVGTCVLLFRSKSYAILAGV